MKSIIYLLTMLLLGILLSCKTEEKMVTIDYSGQPTIVYKTRDNYYDKVPIILSDDKASIISYPAATDLIDADGQYRYPTVLKKGYLLDNRGINANVAFLKINYETYIASYATATLDTLYNLILDKDPLIELYNCGNRYNYSDITQELNRYIKDDKMNRFKKIK